IEIDLADLDSVDRSKRDIDAQIKEFERGHMPDSPISIASAARLLQEDRDLANEIVERLSFLGDPHYMSYDYSDGEKLEKIYRKGWGLNYFSIVSLEDLNAKLDGELPLIEMGEPNNSP